MAKNDKNLFKSVDVISKELDAVDNFVLKYWKKYVYIAIGVVIIVAASLIFIRLFEHNTSSSAKELTSAVTLPELEKAVKNNPSNPLTPYCLLEIASALASNGDFAGAKTACEKAIAFSQDPYAVMRARTDLGYILEAQGKNDEALNVFGQVASDGASSEQFKSEAFYNLGRIYLAMEKKDLAIDALRKSSDVSSDSCVGWPEFSKNLMNRIN